MQFNKPILVYAPCYNCARTVGETLKGIPAELHNRIECLVVDNQSTDGTSDVVLEAIRQRRHPFQITLVRPKKDLGYSGSQKLAYSLAIQSPAVKHVIMLHGDGQYPPPLISKYIPFLDGDSAVVQGYRSKSAYKEEETPLTSYLIIKTLSAVESALTGLSRKEWHSGFVMYRTDFLRRVPLQHLSNTRHIDGELLMCAGVLNLQVAAVPIYKRYKKYEVFKGTARARYIRDVFGAISRYRRKYYHEMIDKRTQPDISCEYDILT